MILCQSFRGVISCCMQCKNSTDNINVNEMVNGSVKLRNCQLESQSHSFLSRVSMSLYFCGCVIFNWLLIVHIDFPFFSVSPPFVHLCAHSLHLNSRSSCSPVPQMNKCCTNSFFSTQQLFSDYISNKMLNYRNQNQLFFFFKYNLINRNIKDK